MGYPIVAAAIECLSPLGGLQVSGGVTPFHFDPLSASGLRWGVSEYPARFGGLVTPIGETMGDTVLLIDDKGAVFGGFADWVVRFGESLPEAVTYLCRPGKPKLWVQKGTPPPPPAPAAPA